MSRLYRLGIEGLIAIGGDGTLNGLQPLAERLPTVLAPKTIDNDLGLNYPSEPDEWVRTRNPEHRRPSLLTLGLAARCSTSIRSSTTSRRGTRQRSWSPRRVSNASARRPRAIAASRSSRSWAGIPATSRSARPTGSRTSCWCPNRRSTSDLLVERVKHLYDLQKNVVIVCGEGIVDEQGVELGAESNSTDPAGNIALSGAAEALRVKMIERLGDRYFQQYRRGSSAREAIFTRKVGHTQRGGRPILFDRFYAAHARLKGRRSAGRRPEQRGRPCCSTTRRKGFHVEGYDANRFRDRWGLIHARQMHPALYDPLLMKPSRLGIDYLMPIFTDAIGSDDAEHMRQTLFDPGNLAQPYHSINTDVHKRIRYLEADGD